MLNNKIAVGSRQRSRLNDSIDRYCCVGGEGVSHRLNMPINKPCGRRHQCLESVL